MASLEIETQKLARGTNMLRGDLSAQCAQSVAGMPTSSVIHGHRARYQDAYHRLRFQQETYFEKTSPANPIGSYLCTGVSDMNLKYRAVEYPSDWQSIAMALTMPLAIAAVSFGCQFFL
ncbi:hypothetical protein FHX16_005285 [Rhizobium sp. BK661]|nr:hypothetical protein [Rhizobium sp. BK661]